EALLGDGVRGERDALAARAAEAVGRLLDAGKTSVLLRDATGAELRVAAATGRKLATEELDAVPIGGGVAGRAVAQGEPIVVPRRAPGPGLGPARPRRPLRLGLVRRDAARRRAGAFRRALRHRSPRRHAVRRRGRRAAAPALDLARAVARAAGDAGRRG